MPGPRASRFPRTHSSTMRSRSCCSRCLALWLVGSIPIMGRFPSAGFGRARRGSVSLLSGAPAPFPGNGSGFGDLVGLESLPSGQ